MINNKYVEVINGVVLIVLALVICMKLAESSKTVERLERKFDKFYHEWTYEGQCEEFDLSEFQRPF